MSKGKKRRLGEVPHIGRHAPAERIEFNPIPNPEGRGYIALSIYPPNTFMGNEHYDVFVGGCGVADCPTLAEAEDELLKQAIRRCNRRIDEARAEMEHYQAAVKKLATKGLVRVPKGGRS